MIIDEITASVRSYILSSFLDALTIIYNTFNTIRNCSKEFGNCDKTYEMICVALSGYNDPKIIKHLEAKDETKVHLSNILEDTNIVSSSLKSRSGTRDMHRARGESTIRISLEYFNSTFGS